MKNIYSELAKYVSAVSTATTAILRKQESLTWSEIEALMADAHLLFIQPFLPAAVPNPKSRGFNAIIWKSILSSSPRFDTSEDTTLGAVNWRGLYLQNGRRTRLAPSGKALRRADRDQEWHESLHREYLDFAGKHVSINQVFLEWPLGPNTQSQQSLSIEFEAGQSHIDRNREGVVVVEISKRLTGRLISDSDRRAILTKHRAKYSEREIIAFSTVRRNLETQLEKAIEFVLVDEPKFFAEFRSSFAASLNNSDSVIRFQEWMMSIFWLRLYCDSSFAGSYFYTVRLPNMLSQVTGYPDSSISFVSKSPTREIREQGKRLVRELTNNHQYKELSALVNERFVNWSSGRKAQPSGDDKEYQLWSLITEIERDSRLPTDFKKLAFVCRLTRFLAGARHEGHILRLTFLLGFTHDQVLGELKGAVEAYGADLIWPRIADQGDGAAVAKWIEANALLLQRWDLALFFETSDESTNYPVAKRLVRIRRLDSNNSSSHARWHGYPTNELELRRSLVRITKEMSGAAAVLISERGATLIVSGKPYLFHYDGERSDRFVALVEGKKSFTESFENNLAVQLEKLADSKDPVWRTRAQQLRELAEAIVVLGHGALIAIRVTDDFRPALPPLAPVWRLHDSQSVAELSDDMMTFALASALDGATEVIFSKEPGREDKVLFRRFADKSFTPWKQQGNDTVKNERVRGRLYKPSNVTWVDMMTFGTRHRSALALSLRRPDVLVLTISVDGPVRLWRSGDKVADVRFKP